MSSTAERNRQIKAIIEAALPYRIEVSNYGTPGKPPFSEVKLDYVAASRQEQRDLEARVTGLIVGAGIDLPPLYDQRLARPARLQAAGHVREHLPARGGTPDGRVSAMRVLSQFLPSPRIAGLALEIMTALIAGFALGAFLALYGISLT